jgi:hypothetical protein
MELTPSDIAFFACLPAAVVFLLVFTLGAPRSWIHDRLGWVVALYALAVVELLGLIVYGVVFGQRVDEVPRLVVGLTLFLALVAKVAIVLVERRTGRLARRLSPTERKTMTASTELLPVWDHAKRVARTIVQTLVSSCPSPTPSPRSSPTTCSSRPT